MLSYMFVQYIAAFKVPYFVCFIKGIKENGEALNVITVHGDHQQRVICWTFTWFFL